MPVRLPPRRLRARDETKRDRVGGDHEHDRDVRRCFGRQCCWAAGGREDRDPASNQFRGQGGKPIIVVVRPTVFDGDITILDVPGLGYRASPSGRRLSRQRRPSPCRPRHGCSSPHDAATMLARPDGASRHRQNPCDERHGGARTDNVS
jgi:hypothetical protein